MAIFIYNQITSEMGGINWEGFELWCTLYDLSDIVLLAEYIAIIKSTVTNFDQTFEEKRNPSKVKEINELIKAKSNKVKKK